MQKKGTVLLSTSLAWLAAAGQKLSRNLARFILLNPVHYSSLLDVVRPAVHSHKLKVEHSLSCLLSKRSLSERAVE